MGGSKLNRVLITGSVAVLFGLFGLVGSVGAQTRAV